MIAALFWQMIKQYKISAISSLHEYHNFPGSLKNVWHLPYMAFCADLWLERVQSKESDQKGGKQIACLVIHSSTW